MDNTCMVLSSSISRLLSVVQRICVRESVFVADYLLLVVLGYRCIDGARVLYVVSLLERSPYAWVRIIVCMVISSIEHGGAAEELVLCCSLAIFVRFFMTHTVGTTFARTVVAVGSYLIWCGWILLVEPMYYGTFIMLRVLVGWVSIMWYMR